MIARFFTMLILCSVICLAVVAILAFWMWLVPAHWAFLGTVGTVVSLVLATAYAFKGGA